jgi:hypothetical protein
VVSVVFIQRGRWVGRPYDTEVVSAFSLIYEIDANIEDMASDVETGLSVRRGRDARDSAFNEVLGRGRGRVEEASQKVAFVNEDETEVTDIERSVCAGCGAAVTEEAAPEEGKGCRCRDCVAATSKRPKKTSPKNNPPRCHKCGVAHSLHSTTGYRPPANLQSVCRSCHARELHSRHSVYRLGS